MLLELTVKPKLGLRMAWHISEGAVDTEKIAEWRVEVTLVWLSQNESVHWNLLMAQEGPLL